MLHKVFLFKTLASTFWTYEFREKKKKNKEFLLRRLCAFGFCTKQSIWHQQLKILLVFFCEAIANQLQQLKGLAWG